MPKITFQQSDISLDYTDEHRGTNILCFAEDNGLDLPSGCLSGHCQTCCTELLQGKIKLLESDEICTQGEITLCQAIPLEDCIFDA